MKSAKIIKNISLSAEWDVRQPIMVWKELKKKILAIQQQLCWKSSSYAITDTVSHIYNFSASIHKKCKANNDKEREKLFFTFTKIKQQK
jgi:hypothetical protein